MLIYEKPKYLQSLKELVSCFQNYEKVANKNFKSLGLTSSQFDIIATLGNTDGMSCKDLTKKTFITKGTLTGILDRLESKNIIFRSSTKDKRYQIIKLTEHGQKIFEEVFPKHLEYMNQFFENFNDLDLLNLYQQNNKLNKKFIEFINKKKDG